MMYLERLSVSGIDTSKYYQSTTFNKGKGTDNDMPNCSQYVVCRTYESVGADKPFKMFSGRSAGGYPMAKDFYKDSIFPKGNQLKTGAIACFDGNQGHVAFVEDVVDDTHAVISESQYDPNKSRRDYKYWQTRTAELKVGQATLPGVGALQGFIYIPVQNIRTSRDANKSQIAIKEDMVNVRLSPNGNIAVQGCYAPVGVYDVMDLHSDEYEWYKLAEDRWVRAGEWLDYYPIEDDEVIRLKKENEELKEKLKEINRLSEV